MSSSVLAAEVSASDTTNASTPAADKATDLAAVQVRATAHQGFSANSAQQATKSNTPLSRTPLSIQVLTRDLLDNMQVTSLATALQSASGVVAGNYGRRGWDDLIIRGQTASDSLFLDGLRTAANNRVAEQVYGFQELQVFKGPGSLLFGQVLPGGLVDMVSKRPQAEAFQRGEVTVGSYGMRQGAVDINQPLSDNGKAALRINALASNSDDATDYVWSRDRWIAPSLSLDFGPNTDFVLLTSYQHRQYIRQQGLPLEGSVLPNANGALRRTMFTGEPTQAPYDAVQSRVGYLLDHRFANGWTLHHGLRWQQFDVDGGFITNNGLSSDLRTLKRKATLQHWGGRTWVQDTYLSRRFESGAINQTLTFGLDAFKTWEWAAQNTCSAANLDVYAPVYSGVTCSNTRSKDTLSIVRSAGLYARDQIEFGPRWQLLLGLRHDDSKTVSDNRLTDTTSSNRDSANTGSAALMYSLTSWLRPYLSYSSSFYPNTGTDAQGKAFEPERGRQWELGTKMELFGGAASLTTAIYDLRRQNVLEDDPINDGYSIAVGEERSRGGEITLTADLGQGLSVNAGYTYVDAIITDDGGQADTTEGQRLNNVPRNSGSLWLNYDPHRGEDGWNVSGGLRTASERFAYTYTIPGYTVFDAGVGYRRGHWNYQLNVRNLFDHDYFAGGLSKAVALGDPRTVLFKVGFAY